MSIVDWLKKLLVPEPPQPPPSKPTRAPRSGAKRPKASASRAGRSDRTRAPSQRTPTSAPAFRRPHATLPDDARWITANEQLEFQGLAIRGGLVYIGHRLSAGYAGTEPSLIDPTLPVTYAPNDSHKNDLPYWPTYANLEPHQRGAYLRWLADGRRDPQVSVGFSFLFLYGIERRVLVERSAAQERGDLPAIRSELIALRDLYGATHEGFRASSAQLIGLIDILQVEHALAARARRGEGTLPASAATLPPPPPLVPDDDTPPVSLQIGLGLYALARTPIDPAWALAWAWYAPDVAIRTPAIRCPEEIAALFAIRYREEYGEGIVLDPGTFERLAIQIQPANALINSQRINAQLLPDVVARSWLSRPLTTMIPAITGELDAYSRWLGRNPDRAGSLAAWAMLPDVLAHAKSPLVAEATTGISALVGDAPVAVVPGEALMRVWLGAQAAPPDKLAKNDAVLLASTLARLGYGIEPDPRSGPTLVTGATIAVFRLPTGAHAEAATEDVSNPESGAFGQAVTLIQLATIVGEADGAASAAEFATMRDHIQASYALSPLEERRLGARLAWLASRPASERTLAGMRKRIAPLAPAERDRLASGLLHIVDADGTVTPDEVTTLQKIWRLLGRDPDRVASDLHAVMTGGELEPTSADPPSRATAARRATGSSRRGPARGDEPVVVRQATPSEPGVRIPPPPGATATVSTSVAPKPGFDLDQATIARKIADTDAVSALLGTLLAEDTSPANQAATPASSTDPESARTATAALLQALAEHDQWSAEAFAALADRHGMMPNGALDLLNELGFDFHGDPLLVEEADGSFGIEPDVLSSVLASVPNMATSSDSV